MSFVYLIRHGQAGTRDNYDALSDLGREQARRLGEYFGAERIHFTTVVSGGLRRQRETAEQVRDAYQRAGLRFPRIDVRETWNEFDLDQVYQSLAPKLSADNADFKREYDRLSAEIRATAGDATATVHRRWAPTDVQVVEAWIRGTYPYEGESWEGFCERIRACDLCVNGAGEEGNIAIFTSATPTAIWAGSALEVYDHRVLRIAAVLHNASFSVLRVRGGQVRLFSLNNVPHLGEPRLRTHR